MCRAAGWGAVESVGVRHDAGHDAGRDVDDRHAGVRQRRRALIADAADERPPDGLAAGGVVRRHNARHATAITPRRLSAGRLVIDVLCETRRARPHVRSFARAAPGRQRYQPGLATRVPPRDKPIDVGFASRRCGRSPSVTLVGRSRRWTWRTFLWRMRLAERQKRLISRSLGAGVGRMFARRIARAARSSADAMARDPAPGARTDSPQSCRDLARRDEGGTSRRLAFRAVGTTCSPSTQTLIPAHVIGDRSVRRRRHPLQTGWPAPTRPDSEPCGVPMPGTVDGH